jgi:2-dehydro-3-deoxyphosphooctonate aldolase (KDO 8-P synthase)
MESFRIGDAVFGGGELAFLLGPCVVESPTHALFMAREIKAICDRVGVGFVYKSSFDKANRSSIESFRGEGMEFGLEVLSQVKADVGVPAITDVHEPWQVEKAAEVADILQIPAFLCRQTDLLVEAAKSGKP